MKKTIILFAFALTAISGFSAQTAPVQTQATPIEVTKQSQEQGVKIDSTVVSPDQVSQKEVYEDGKTFFKDVSTGVSGAAGTAYDVIVQQQRMYAFQYLLVGIICILFFYLSMRFMNKHYAKLDENETKNPIGLTLSIVFGCLAIWSGIVFALNYSVVVQGLVNPDFAAMKDIIQMFKSINK